MILYQNSFLFTDKSRTRTIPVSLETLQEQRVGFEPRTLNAVESDEVIVKTPTLLMQLKLIININFFCL